MAMIPVLILSALLGFIILIYIRRYDIWEPVPLNKLLAITFVGGFLALGIAVFFYWGISTLLPYSDNTLIRSYLLIGPVEEYSKLASFFILYFLLLHRHIDEPIDAIIYMSSIALGFSIFENILYSHHYVAHIILFRYFVASPAHILFSIPMALPAEAILNRSEKWGELLKFWIIASLLHGTWDALVYNRIFAFLFAILLLIMFTLAKSRITRGLLTSQYYPDIREFFNHGDTGEPENVYCVECHTDRDLPVIENRGVEYYHCNECGSTIVSRDTAFRIIRIFFATFDNLAREYLPSKKDELLYTIRDCVYIDDLEGYGVLDMKELVDRTDVRRTAVE